MIEQFSAYVLRITYSVLRISSKLSQRISHLDGRERGLEPLVPEFGSGPVKRLFYGLGGQDAQGHRQAVRQHDFFDPLAHSRREVVELHGLGLDGRSRADD